MKLKLLLLILLSLLFNLTLAQQLPNFPQNKLPPLIRCDDFFQCLGFFFLIVLRIILVLALFLATIFIAWAGILYITKSGPEETKKIHRKIIWAVIGLVVALMSFAFVRYLEMRLFQIEEVKTPSGPLESLSKSKSLFLPNFVFAQTQIKEPKVPTKISCGSSKLPSILEKTQLQKDIWQICLIFYLTRIIYLLYVIALFLGVIFLSLAGISYITKPEKTADIHKKLIYGLVGIIFAILSFTIVKIIELFFLKLEQDSSPVISL